MNLFGEESREYIGISRVTAKPMTRGDYNKYKGWTIPEDEDPEEKGYLITHEIRGVFIHVTWQPSRVFGAIYSPCSGMSFGEAIEVLKEGGKVARQGWNGKGMWISLSYNPGGDSSDGKREIAAENFWSDNNSEYARQNGGSAVVLPCFTMKTATGEILMGWLASQSDMLANDWCVVE